MTHPKPDLAALKEIAVDFLKSYKFVQRAPTGDHICGCASCQTAVRALTALLADVTGELAGKAEAAIAERDEAVSELDQMNGVHERAQLAERDLTDTRAERDALKAELATAQHRAKSLERSRRFSAEQWAEAGRQALLGDTKQLRLRIDLHELPPVKAETQPDESLVLVFDGERLASLDAECTSLRAELAAIKSAITDPENQPSQYGTVTLAWHEAEMAGARARVAELEEGLRPFAEQAEHWSDEPDDTPMSTTNGEESSALDFWMRDLRRAARLLQPQKGE